MKDPFGGRGGWILGAAVLGLAVTMGFGLFSSAPSAILSPEADGFSRSVIGYHGLVAFLEAMELPVHISRYQTAERLAPGTALMILAPPLEGEGLERATTLMTEAREKQIPVVLVAPQWRVQDLHKKGSSWVGRIGQLSQSSVEATLATVLELESEDMLRIERTTATRPAEANSRPPLPEALEDESIAGNGLVAELPRPQLLHRKGTFDNHLGNEYFSLIAQLFEEDVWIISDPDLVNNNGLGLGDNAAIIHRFLTQEIGARAVMIDETHHGFLSPPSIWRELASFPLILVSLHLLAMFLALVWAASTRFGRPQPAPPRVAAGAGTLIDNTARLIRLAGHTGDTVQRYFQLTVRDAAQRCALPPNLEFSQQVQRLQKLGQARGLATDLTRIARRVDTIPAKPQDPRRALSLCRELATWRKEITNGFR
ncbi:MAG: hypothetical protein K0U98_04470 [Deltaproteobacteria bacterium]|nr:hypothetical protein [Deltaproteobacteria bacterium]